MLAQKKKFNLKISKNPSNYLKSHLIDYLRDLGIKGVSQFSKNELVKLITDVKFKRKRDVINKIVNKAKQSHKLIKNTEKELKKIEKDDKEDEKQIKEGMSLIKEIYTNKLSKLNKELDDEDIEQISEALNLMLEIEKNKILKEIKEVKEVKERKEIAEGMELIREINNEKLNEKERQEIEEGMEIMREIDYNKSLKDLNRLLRRNRFVKSNEGIIKQDPPIEITTQSFDELIYNPVLSLFNETFYEHLEKLHTNLYKNDKIMSANIKVFYAYALDDQDDDDDVPQYAIYSHSKSIIFDKNITFIEDPLKPDSFFRIPVDNAVSGMQTVKLGYMLIYEVKKGKVLGKDELKKLKAYKPSSNRKFHELTCSSTTNDKICIYESFMDIIGLTELKYLRKTEKRKELTYEMLENEGEDILKNVIEGNLIKSLQLLTIKYKTKILIVFYQEKESDNKDYPILVNNGEYKNISFDELNEYENTKAMLYDKNNHVAPFIIKCKANTEVKKYVNHTFKLNPNTLKVKQKDENKEIESRKIKNILGYDCEVYSEDKSMNSIVYCITVYGILHGEIIKKKWYGENVINKFIDYIDSIATKINNEKSRPKGEIEKIYIYGFNNSNFDNLLIYKELYNKDHRTKYNFTSSSIKKIEYNNIHIFDLCLFYSGSLKKVCNDFDLDIEKGVYPYTFPNKNNLYYCGKIPSIEYYNNEKDYLKACEELGENEFNLKKITKKYCLLDSQLVYELAKKHIKESIGFINGKLYDTQKCGTGAGVAKKMFQNIFQLDVLEQSPDKIIEREKQAYKGGRTEVFKKYFKSDGITKMYNIDANSSYPASMVEMMPYKYIKTLVYNENVRQIDEITEYFNYYAKVEYMGNDDNFIPNILTRVSTKNVIPCRKTDYMFIWGIELIEAIKNNCKVTIKECDFYEPKAIFKEYIEHFYNKRLEIKETNKSKSSYYKLLLNSLYGKFGQRQFYKKTIVKNTVELYEKLGKNSVLIDYIMLDNNTILMEYDEKNSYNNSIGKLMRFSSYITASGRTRLSKMMRKIGHEHVYYCDTDSIFTTKKPLDKYISKSKLGLWKYETKTPIIEGLFLAPKFYYYEDENKDSIKKGKSINANKLIKNDYVNLINNDVETVPQTNLMFYRSFNGVKIQNTTRKVKTVYNKRIWNGNDSKAFEIINDWNK